MDVASSIDPFIYRLAIFVLAIFVGYYVVWSVTAALHTPLMSGSNAISGITIIGAILCAGAGEQGNFLSALLGFLAVVMAMINIVGGFMVTDRMLHMFKRKKD